MNGRAGYREVRPARWQNPPGLTEAMHLQYCSSIRRRRGRRRRRNGGPRPPPSPQIFFHTWKPLLFRRGEALAVAFLGEEQAKTTLERGLRRRLCDTTRPCPQERRDVINSVPFQQPSQRRSSDGKPRQTVSHLPAAKAAKK